MSSILFNLVVGYFNLVHVFGPIILKIPIINLNNPILDVR